MAGTFPALPLSSRGTGLVKERKMKRILFGLAVVAAASIVTAGPASARDYRYCLQSLHIGIPGDCSYSTYRQCRAAASGRNADCFLNPRVAFSRSYRHHRR